MSNKLLYLVVGLLLLGGVFVMAKNQNKMSPDNSNQEATVELDEEIVSEEETEAEEVDTMEEKVEESQVSVTDTGFEPQSVTIKAGTKVVWTNNIDTTANVSSAMHPTHEDYPPLNLGNFEPETKVELVFDQPGTFKYHDHLNPSKFGTVVVE